MPICSALTQTNLVPSTVLGAGVHDAYCVSRKADCPRTTQYAILPLSPSLRSRVNSTKGRNTRAGFTLIELIVVISMISLIVLIAQVNFFAVLRKNTFKEQVQDFVSTMQMAANAAAESDRRYEVIIDLTEQSYLLRQITTSDLSEVLDEEIIVQNNFGSNCRVAYVEFDDGDYTNEGRAKFRAGHSGWQYGGKIVLLDETEKPYSIVVNRLNRMIELKEGDVELLVPKAEDEVPF
jgi:prepilin-type N-terminal cleavage/methylation domain-containing protein